MNLTWLKHIQANLGSQSQQFVDHTAYLSAKSMRRFKEEAEGSTIDLKEQLAAAHQERHAVEEQAKQQVLPALHLHGIAHSEGLQPVHTPPPPLRPFLPMETFKLSP